MKIGIVTQPLQLNYGGLLQNYALQRILRDFGHEPTTLDWTWERDSEVRRLIDNAKTRIIWKLGRGRGRKLKRYKPSEKEYATIGRNTIRFIKKHISKTEPVTTSSGFRHLLEEGGYEALISGSDQVWRPKYSAPLLPDMFLRFANNKEVYRIAYAASFGTDEWEFSPKMTEDCALLAKQYDHISVREDSGVALCREHLGVEATHVLDPTLLLQKKDYVKLITEANETTSSGTLFYYVLDPSEEKTAFVMKAADEMNLKAFKVMPCCQRSDWTKARIKHQIEDCVYPAVTQWLRGFMDAEMTIVDSFHGMVFSIIFNKPFWAIGNKSRGLSRFDSLLKLFGLEDRLIDSSELQSATVNKSIDWERVNKQLEELRQHSISWLEESLK
ncbi:MAG: polysaccharide pyruvyl transferase family protein [Bacteroidales bacterium]|nr:polysaccharide pyruvyl transferase family protein [Bacteroidales bacterium]